MVVTTKNMERYSHAIFENLINGVVTINKHGIIQVANPKALKMFGYKADEILGKSVTLLMPEPHASNHDSYLQRFFHTGVASIVGFTREVQGKHKSGKLFPINLGVTQIKGDEPLFIGSIQDLSTLSEINTSLEKSRQQLELSQQYANVGHWHFDLTRKRIEVSSLIEALCGLQSQDGSFSIRQARKVLVAEDATPLDQAVTDCITTGKLLDLQYRIITPDNEFRWLHIKGNYEKKHNYLHGIIQDITDKKRTENREGSLGKILDNSLHEIYVFDIHNFMFIETNIKAEENLGYGSAELKLMTPLDLKKEMSIEQFSQQVQPLLDDADCTVAFESVHYRKDNTHYPVEIKLQRIPFGNIDTVVAFVEDITERLNVINDLKQAKADAEKANNAKSEFLSRMSHELRTPMNAILGFTQLLATDDDKPLDDDQLDSLNEVSKAGNHLLELINEVLDLSRIDAGKVKLSIESVDLLELFSDISALSNPIAQQYGIQLANELSESIVVPADKMRLKQVLLNLISNAIKYNSSNGSVTLSASVISDQKVRIEVRDTGQGLNEEQQTSLFSPFERLGAESTSIEGTGIGLTISKKFVDMMGGIIGIDSQLDVGSCFWIELPLLQAKSHIVTEQSSSIQSQQGIITQDNRYSILYIEDNLSNLKVVETIVTKRMKQRFICASSGGLGIEMALAHQPDLILLDLRLPGLDGFAVKSILSKEPTLKDIPIIAVSANAMPDEIQQTIECGFNHFISKPIDMPSFIATIEQVLTSIDKH